MSDNVQRTLHIIHNNPTHPYQVLLLPSYRRVYWGLIDLNFTYNYVIVLVEFKLFSFLQVTLSIQIRQKQKSINKINIKCFIFYI